MTQVPSRDGGRLGTSSILLPDQALWPHLPQRNAITQVHRAGSNQFVGGLSQTISQIGLSADHG